MFHSAKNVQIFIVTQNLALFLIRSEGHNKIMADTRAPHPMDSKFQTQHWTAGGGIIFIPQEEILPRKIIFILPQERLLSSPLSHESAYPGYYWC